MLILILIFLLEGLGFIYPHNNIIYGYLIVPFFLFLFLSRHFKEIKLPQKLTLGFYIFLFFSLVSLFFSVDKQISFEMVLFYLSTYLIFVFFYNQRERGKRLILVQLFVGSIVFIFHSFILNYLKPNFLKDWPYPVEVYHNFVYSFFHHNHLGDFLGLVLIFCLYLVLSNSAKEKVKDKDLSVKVFRPLFLVILFFFLFSFSRTAFIALIIVGSSILKKFSDSSQTVFLRKKGVVISLIVIGLTGAFFIFTLKGFNPEIKYFEKVFPKRELFSPRFSYIKQGWDAFLKKPFFGWGPGNFQYGSLRFSKKFSFTTDTAHNIFLDILVENGLPAFLAFTALILLVLERAKKKSVCWVLFLYILITFLFDYTYKIYSFFVFFWILGGLIYKEKKNFSFSVFNYGVVSLALFFVFSLIFTSFFLLRIGKYSTARFFYPFNKTAHMFYIDQQLQQDDFSRGESGIRFYQWVTPEGFDFLQTAAVFYQKFGQTSKALFFYNRAYQLNKSISFDIIEQLYWLKRRAGFKKEASLFLKKALYDRKEIIEGLTRVKEKVGDFCKKIEERVCLELGLGRLRYFYEPKPNSLEKPNPWVPYNQVKNTINSDRLNERFDYTVKKPPKTFRIITLGGSVVYGLYVKTENNWPERLEEMLNQRLSCSNIDKFEVINLGMHGYDIEYGVNRFRLRGIKYQPDLVLWLINNSELIQYNEVMRIKLKKYDQEEEKKGKEKKKVEELNKLYSSWEKAFNETRLELGDDKILSLQKGFFKEVANFYKGPVVLLTFSSTPRRYKSFFQQLVKEQPEFIFSNSLTDISKKKSLVFPDGLPNSKGYALISREIFDFLKENNLFSCRN